MEDFDRRSNDWDYFLNLMQTISRTVRALGSGRRAYFHIFSQTATSKCDAAFLEDFPEFNFPQSRYPPGMSIDTLVSVKGADPHAWPEMQDVHMVLNVSAML